MDDRLHGHPINKSLQTMRNEKSNFINSEEMHRDTFQIRFQVNR